MAKLSSYLRGNTTITGITTFNNVIINSGESTGTSDQNLQVSGGSYISGNTGIGSATPQTKLDVSGDLLVTGNARITGILTVGQSSVTIDGTNNKITTPKLDYAGISSSISETAYDVFVYDTRKDSDGGAWRKRTQHTSWYNTTDYENDYIKRGSRKDFPAIAVLVASNNGLDIYDGDDPDLPLWVRFKTNSRSPIYITPNPGCLAALNGIVFVGANNGASGSYTSEFGFIHDKMRLHQDSGKNQTRDSWVTGMVQKSEGFSWVSQTSPISISNDHELVDRKTNDISMTVLLNAPIDEVSGLPRPTIAVATDGGVSIIKNDGTVFDAVGTTFDIVNAVSFDINNRIICSSGTAGTDQAMFSTFAIPSSDLSNVFPGGENAYYRDGYGSTDLPWYINGASAGNHSINDVSKYKNDIAFGTEDDGSTTNPGLKIISENVTSPANGMLCGVSTSYNTGWMHGDIKGAFLSDTSTVSMPGSTLISNGDFSDGSNGWILQSGWTVSSGTATCDGTNTAYIYQQTGLPIDTPITVTVTITAYTSGSIRLGATGVAPSIQHSGTGTYSTTFVTRSSASSGVEIYSINFVGTIDNVIVTLAEYDRSVNNNPLQVFGTITKSPVATGAELVAYSGYSNSNYLVQPYNSDLNFGTGDFSTSFWISTTDANLTGFVFDRGGPVNTDPRFAVYIESDAIFLYTYASGASSTLSHSFDEYENQWTHVAMTRSSSGAMQIFINGTRVSSGSATARNVTSSTNPELTIGNRFSRDGTNPLDATISLLRISGSIPSAEQVKKMYEDEKVLFQENAACTLYGSSDAVTALAYDDSTNILYAGTSSGRSDFQGLRRINNTTTAVTTAMSASNGLVAEQ